MELTKEQNRKAGMPLIKAHHWFGSDKFKKVFKNYDYYVDEENTIFYVYPKKANLKKVV